MGSPFALSDRGYAQHATKSSLRLFLSAKIEGLGLQKHANRLIHPLKIEDELTMAYSFPNVIKSDSFCSQNLALGAPKRSQNLCYPVYKINFSFSVALVSFGFQFGPILGCMLGGPAAKIHFCGASGSARTAFCSWMVSRDAFEWYWEAL